MVMVASIEGRERWKKKIIEKDERVRIKKYIYIQIKQKKIPPLILSVLQNRMIKYNF